MDLLDTPTGHPDAGFVDRALNIEGMFEADPADSIGAADGRPVPLRTLRGGRADSVADVMDAFGDHGFRLHPDAGEWPHLAHLCAVDVGGRALVTTYREGDVTLSVHPDVASACAFFGMPADDVAAEFAFQL